MAISSRYDERSLAVATRQLETERSLVTEWRFPPGGHTGWHKHAFDYIVVPLSTGELIIETSEEEVRVPLVSGQSYGHERGAEHDVVNDNAFEFVFIEIEIKP